MRQERCRLSDPLRALSLAVFFCVAIVLLLCWDIRTDTRWVSTDDTCLIFFSQLQRAVPFPRSVLSCLDFFALHRLRALADGCEKLVFDDLTMQGVLSEVAFDCSGQLVLVAGDFTLDPNSIFCFLDAPQVGGVPQITLGALPSALCHGDCVGQPGWVPNFGTCQVGEGHWSRPPLRTTWCVLLCSQHVGWLRTVGVVRAKRPLFSGFGAVYDQRLSLMCNGDERCLWHPWPYCSWLRDSFSSLLM